MTPDPGTLASFALACLLIELTPGPNMAWLVIVTLQQGRGAGLAAVLGVAAGLGLIGLAAAFGLSALIAARPELYQALRIIGVAYMVWLAWDAWRDADTLAAGPSAPAAARADTVSSPLEAGRRGFMLNLLNPKAAAFYITFLPTFVTGETARLSAVLVLTTISVTIATGVHLSLVAAAGQLQPILTGSRNAMLVGKAMAAVLAGVAVWLWFALAR